jgi:hypothetical protein
MHQDKKICCHQMYEAQLQQHQRGQPLLHDISIMTKMERLSFKCSYHNDEPMGRKFVSEDQA